MNNHIIRGDLNGLCVITHRGTSSPLRVGESATYNPFDGLYGESLKGIGIPVSDEKLDGIIRRQEEKYKRVRYTGNGVRTKVLKQTQQFHTSVVSLIKNVSQTTFQTNLTQKVVEFITGKKCTWTNKGIVFPKLTQEELIICTLAEFALDKFHTLNGIELKCSFYEGGEIYWKSKH